MAILLYESETCTQTTLKRIQTFINKCLRRILHPKWTDKVSNTILWKWTKQIPIENEIKKKWRWIGHTLRKPQNTITRQAITWNPPGKRRRVRPRNTWQRDTEKETKEMGYTRREMERMATDRKQWRSLVDGLCSQRANWHKYVSMAMHVLCTIYSVYNVGKLMQNIWNYTEDTHNIYQTSHIHHFGEILIGIALSSYIRRKNPAYAWQLRVATRKPEVRNTYFALVTFVAQSCPKRRRQ